MPRTMKNRYFPTPQVKFVAILNPYNTRLKSDVSMLTNTRCHFYLVKAEDYDLAVDSVRRAYLKESGVF